MVNPQLTTIDQMPSLPPLQPNSPFKSNYSGCQKLVYSHQKNSRALSNPYRLSLVDYLYTYRNNLEYIPDRLDVPFVKMCLLQYLARYIPKWKNYDPNNYSTSYSAAKGKSSISKESRENNRECARIYDGFRGVWCKWKKAYAK